MKSRNIDARRNPRNNHGGGKFSRKGGSSNIELVPVRKHLLSWTTHRGPGAANCLQTATVDGSDDIFIRNSNDQKTTIRANKAELKAFAIGILNGTI